MTKFDELKERFPNLIPVPELRANVSIVDLAVQWGYEPQPQKGKSRPVLEHKGLKDTIVIKNPQDAASQVYQRAGDFADSGTVIDFIRNRMSTVFSAFNRPGQHEFKNITNVLYDYLRIDPEQINRTRQRTESIRQEAPTKQLFASDQFDLRPLGPENYLTQRQIAPETINRPEFATKVVGQISYMNPVTNRIEPYQMAKDHPERSYVQFTNIAFPYYNGLSSEVSGLELRNEHVKMHAPGSDRYSSVFVSNPPPQLRQAFIMESAIDALSHQQLRSIRGDDKYDSVYFSTGGQLTQEQINTMTKYINSFDKAPDWKISLAFDNDPSGHRFDLQFIQQIIAGKFPITPTTGGIGRISYLLPQEENFLPTREELLSRVRLYNANVHAQISDTDPIAKKEISSQLIHMSSAGDQMAINIPMTCAALSVVNQHLLELTGFNQRITINKANGKDFNEDLTRAVEQGRKFRYQLTDETGENYGRGNVATLMVRAINQEKHGAEADGRTTLLSIRETQPFGFSQDQVRVKIEQGVCVESTQTAAFKNQLQAEKKERNQTAAPDNKREPSLEIKTIPESPPGSESKHPSRKPK